ncbi:hypothetical protein G5C65_32965 [Streptomyces sp. SB3404]|uniref:Uncharacterized protein n=1 Tax=Streptomyces boncukensis TaxID=2711219 RepID=A0A6G4X890_9ACTN|nr:hypothetical protein [Streptomyces boncukensis]
MTRGSGGTIRSNNQGRPQCDRRGQHHGYTPPPRRRALFSGTATGC